MRLLTIVLAAVAVVPAFAQKPSGELSNLTWVEAEQVLRASTTSNPRVPFYFVVLAAALAEQGRRDEAMHVMQDAMTRHPDYRLGALTGYWVATDPRFLAGRDRLVARAGELGLPP